MTLDRSRVWAGDLNARALDPQPASPVGLIDTTLRTAGLVNDGPLDTTMLLALARELDDAGVDRLEVALDRSQDARAGLDTLVAAGLRAELWARVPAPPAPDVAVAGVVLEWPLSGSAMRMRGVDARDAIAALSSAVSRVVTGGMPVLLCGVDASRADPAFLDRAWAAAVEAGAAELVVEDTAGIATPEGAAMLVSRAVDRLDVPIHWVGRDDFGLGIATSVAAVQAGAAWVHASVDGVADRGGATDLCELALALEGLYGIPTRLDLHRARALSRALHAGLGTSPHPWKAVTGRLVTAVGPDDVAGGWPPFDPTILGDG